MGELMGTGNMDNNEFGLYMNGVKIGNLKEFNSQINDTTNDQLNRKKVKISNWRMLKLKVEVFWYDIELYIRFKIEKLLKRITK